MKTYHLPVTWEVCGTVPVQAESLAAALAKFNPLDHELPQITEYVESSFRLTDTDEEAVRKMTRVIS